LSFEGSRLVSCHFTELSTIGTKTYRIDLDNVVVGAPAAGAPATIVDGPRVRWRNSTGPVGTIAPGTYTT
jgi:hypothetical protein